MFVCFCLSIQNLQSNTNEPLNYTFQCKGRYIVPIKMLNRPPRAEDDHEDSLVLSKNVGNSSFQVATLVNAIAGNGLYPLLYVKYVATISTFFPVISM